jgi:hypothetical protein
MKRFVWPLSALLLIAGSADLSAQHGVGFSASTTTVPPRTEVSYVKANQEDARGTTHWFQLLILWRGQPGWSDLKSSIPLPDSTARVRALANYDLARKTALMRDAIFLGGNARGIGYYAELDSARTVVTILDHSYRIPPRDSALIVLVDRIDGVGGMPTVTGTAIVDGRFPTPQTPKTWTSGDTVFTIRVPDRQQENMLMVLQRDTIVAAFLR